MLPSGAEKPMPDPFVKHLEVRCAMSISIVVDPFDCRRTELF